MSKGSGGTRSTNSRSAHNNSGSEFHLNGFSHSAIEKQFYEGKPIGYKPTLSKKEYEQGIKAFEKEIASNEAKYKEVKERAKQMSFVDSEEKADWVDDNGYPFKKAMNDAKLGLEYFKQLFDRDYSESKSKEFAEKYFNNSKRYRSSKKIK